MTIQKHPDYSKETERLSYTKGYMQAIIQLAELNQGQHKTNLKEAMEGIGDSDSSLNYTSLLATSNFLNIAEGELKHLKEVLPRPYFARINFKAADKQEEEILYIGKISLHEPETQEPIVIDWRSPIANVYYDGRIGDVSYEAYGEEYEGNLSKKRQYKIEEGKLLDFRDVDLTTTDELLQESLAGKADHRLTEIVSTIQAEQNQIIRADLNRPIIVQGAAGSGKTTIALHRISYFLYHYADSFRPEELMIIAPNRMFIDYIGDVLPELGVNRIRQTTYIDYMQEAIGEKMKVCSPQAKLIKLVNGEWEDPTFEKWISGFKGSLKYKKLLDRYISRIRLELCPKDDFMLEKYRLVNGTKLKRLYLTDYNYLSFQKRNDKIKEVLKSHLRQKKKMILDNIQKKYDTMLEQALFHVQNKEKRKQRVVDVMEWKEERFNTLQKEAKTAVSRYIKPLAPKKILTYYKELFNDSELFAELSEDILSAQQAERFRLYQQSLLAGKEFEVEDLAPLFYMKHKINGISKEHRARNVVIDEAQDYSHFQLYALKAGLETDMFTIVGDLAQGIHSYRGLKSWKTVTEKILPRSNFMTLKKSYRTTIEIMDLANATLQLLKQDFPTVEPVVRHGQKPSFQSFEGEEQFVTSVLKSVKESREKGCDLIAVIGKNDRECAVIYELMKNHSTEPVQLLLEHEPMNKGHLLIMPSYVSKGLEFDSVIIACYNDFYEQTELDVKLLYVAMTRAMHVLHLISPDREKLLLHQVKENILRS
ncbi:RNA polymerase recycling motor HelD [Priestia koreensis]|uniref:RNA polymerase recycling motor HelD n=1 Tax=Priestia koreensis TaxID=284581 RepID=UPI00203B6978|nr:RNA polymerase recycling motor HelD [Priestia koreensis]MCM3003245.1 AAA family ATPase [Priestia koreensis]